MVVCKDEIYKVILENEIRDKIHEGSIRVDEYNNLVVHEFLSLLKYPLNYAINIKDYLKKY